MVETSDEWILQRTGIRERHIVDPGVATSDLGKEAALKAIAKAGLTPAFAEVTMKPTTPFTPPKSCTMRNEASASLNGR